METVTNLVLMAVATLAGVVAVAVGLFAVVSMLWEELLEPDRADRSASHLSRAA